MTRSQLRRWPATRRPPGPSSGAWLTLLGPPPSRDFDRTCASDVMPLAGLRVCVKDIIDVEGAATTAGSGSWSRSAAEDAIAVTRLRRAGAEMVGKGHTNEFAYGIDGLNDWLPSCLNPWAPDRLIGGSSSGPAAAVASGEADIGLGTDTAGSLRIPAAFTGLWGFRPSRDRVPLDGIVPLSPSLDTCGVMTRDAGTLIAAMSALMDIDPPAAISAPSRIGVLGSGGAEALLLDALGSEPVAIAFPNLAEMRGVQKTIQTAEATAAHTDLEVPVYSAATAMRLKAGRAISPGELKMAYAKAERLTAAIFGAFDAADIDFLALPTAAFAAPKRTATEVDGVELREELLRYVAPLSLLGAPVLAVPIGELDGLPVGAQLLARPGRDESLLGLATGIL